MASGKKMAEENKDKKAARKQEKVTGVMQDPLCGDVRREGRASGQN